MQDDDGKKCREMIAAIARGVAETQHFIGRDRLDPRVTDALMAVPRHEFVPADLRGRAYENRPLRIGHGQTISQPYIVAVMTDMARLTAQSRVLEIGTGCGYQTAILAQIAASVTSVERIAALAATARARLARLGYTNIQIYHADGVNGWAAEKAYDAIIVTAAAARLPAALVAQLRCGGRMVIPLGRPAMSQSLTVLEKDAEGALRESCHLPVAFVPLVSGIVKS
jgi:protein-L-isoaspartate(D-aspartate) O-methyltransferase